MLDRSRQATLAVSALVLVAGLPAAAQEVSGGFESTEVTITPGNVCAFPVRSQWNPDDRYVLVLLSQAEVDVQTVVQHADPELYVRNGDVKEDDLISLYVSEDDSVRMVATKREGMVQFIDDTDMTLRAEITRDGADGIAGRVWTDGPVASASGSYAVDLSFSTPVTRPPAGETLGEGGGEPGAALTALIEGFRDGDWGRVSAALPESYLEEIGCFAIDPEGMTDERALDCAADDLPFWITETDHEILGVAGGEDRGDSAVVEMRVANPNGMKVFHLVTLDRAATGWVYKTFDFGGLVN